jgi:single-stranded DNA-binding protein
MYYNKIEIAGNVTYINFGTSAKGNSYVNGYIQSYENANFNGKSYKKNYISLKFTAFNENADMMNALGIKKDSNLKIEGFLKYNKYKNRKGEEIEENILIVDRVDETFTGQKNNTQDDIDDTFFSTPSKPRKSTNVNDEIDDDLPF